MAKATDASGADTPPSYVEYEVRDVSAPIARQLRQRVMGCHWEYQARMLEILEWVCGTDRQFERARKAALDLINGEERALTAIITRTLTAPQGDGNAATR